MGNVIETRLTSIGITRTQASVHVTCEGWSFTISNIIIYKQDNGKLKICLPMTNIGANKKPAITLQGNLKEAVVNAIEKDYQSMLMSGEKVLHSSHTFSQDMSVEQGELPQY